MRKYGKMIKIRKRGNRKQGQMWIRNGAEQKTGREHAEENCWRNWQLPANGMLVSSLPWSQIHKRKLCVFITWDLHLLILQIEVIDFPSTHCITVSGEINYGDNEKWFDCQSITKVGKLKWWSPVSSRTDVKLRASQQGGFEAESDQGKTGDFLIYLL